MPHSEAAFGGGGKLKQDAAISGSRTFFLPYEKGDDHGARERSSPAGREGEQQAILFLRGMLLLLQLGAEGTWWMCWQRCRRVILFRSVPWPAPNCSPDGIGGGMRLLVVAMAPDMR
jgi:hypothetical protein